MIRESYQYAGARDVPGTGLRLGQERYWLLPPGSLQQARIRIPHPSLRYGDMQGPPYAGEVRAGQVRAGQVRAGQVSVEEVRASEVRAGEVCAGESRPAKGRFAQGRLGEI